MDFTDKFDSYFRSKKILIRDTLMVTIFNLHNALALLKAIPAAVYICSLLPVLIIIQLLLSLSAFTFQTGMYRSSFAPGI